MSDGKKQYIIPVPLDPGVVRCFKVYVPADPLYLGAFWNAYEYFTKNNAWERDAEHRAIDAAALWRVSYELARSAYDAGEDCDVAFQLRQNTVNPCLLEQSIDGGETWQTAFNYLLCGGSVLPVPPYGGSPSGASDAAASATTNIFQTLVTLAGDCSMTRSEYVSTATAYMRLFDPSYSNPSALGGVYDAYCLLDPGEQELAQSECPYELFKESIQSCYDAGGVLNDLECLADAIGSWLDAASDELMASLTAAAAALSGQGWQAASGDAGGGGGGGFGTGDAYGSECGWCYEWDYTAGAFDVFEHGSLDIIAGVYVPGVGYQNDTESALNLKHNYDAFYSITRMEMDFTSDGGIHTAVERARLMTQHGTFAGSPFNPTDPTEYHHMVHTGGGTIEAGRTELATAFTQVEIQGFSDELFTTYPTFTLTRLRICGTGPDPYAP
jgi:hypothetical protein